MRSCRRVNDAAVEDDLFDPVVVPVVNESGDVIFVVDRDGWFEEEDVGGGIWFEATGVVPPEDIRVPTRDDLPCFGG